MLKLKGAMATATTEFPSTRADGIGAMRSIWRRLLARSRRLDPEEQKLRSIIDVRRAELFVKIELKRSELGSPPPLPPAGTTAQLPGRARDEALLPLAVRLIESYRPEFGGLEGAYVHLEAVEDMLVLLSDDQRLRVQLELECEPRDGAVLLAEPALERVNRLLPALNGGAKWLPAQRLEAEEILRDVILWRNYLGRHDVGQRRIKTGYVWRLTGALSGLIVLLAIAASVDAATRSVGADIGLALAAGAVGGALSGLFRLRSSVGRVRELKASWPSIFIQPVIGAVGGLIVYGIFASGVVKIANLALTSKPSAWHAILVVAFLGGFSERFFLKSLTRVGATADDAAPQS